MNNTFAIGSLRPCRQEWDAALFLGNKRPSAVVILIFDPNTADPKLLLIRRSSKTNSHRGQIGFPGGRFEEGDDSPRATALREAFEEVGVQPHLVEVLGEGETIQGIDGSYVVPVFACAEIDPKNLVKNADEVDEIHLVALRSVMRHCKREFTFNLYGCLRRSFLYDCGSVSIWGLSAEILARADIHATI